VFPEYTQDYQAKDRLPPNLLDDGALNVFSVTIVRRMAKSRASRCRRMILAIVARVEFQQRTRMSFLYYHAERHHFAVVGTANKNEHDMGFFVKYGDAGWTSNPLVHLYKTQIYQLAPVSWLTGGNTDPPANLRHVQRSMHAGRILLSTAIRHARSALVRVRA